MLNGRSERSKVEVDFSKVELMSAEIDQGEK